MSDREPSAPSRPSEPSPDDFERVVSAAREVLSSFPVTRENAMKLAEALVALGRVDGATRVSPIRRRLQAFREQREGEPR